jgi:hypothetical protein
VEVNVAMIMTVAMTVTVAVAVSKRGDRAKDNNNQQAYRLQSEPLVKPHGGLMDVFRFLLEGVSDKDIPTRTAQDTVYTNTEMTMT